MTITLADTLAYTLADTLAYTLADTLAYTLADTLANILADTKSLLSCIRTNHDFNFCVVSYDMIWCVVLLLFI